VIEEDPAAQPPVDGDHGISDIVDGVREDLELIALRELAVIPIQQDTGPAVLSGRQVKDFESCSRRDLEPHVSQVVSRDVGQDSDVAVARRVTHSWPSYLGRDGTGALTEDQCVAGAPHAG
jgi:hypothetical protein